MRVELTDVDATLASRKVLGPISLGVKPGERIALLGPNGAGKSTLLRRMAGLLGGGGDIRLDGVPIERLTPMQRARAISFLPQQRQIAWPIPVHDLVALGRLPHGVDPSRLRDTDLAVINRILTRLDLGDWSERPATALSQGEQARVLLARALATEAPVLLADEPIASLDPRQQLETLAILAQDAAMGRTVVAVLHDLTLAAAWASRVILIVEGRILVDASPGEALTPACIRTAFGVEISRDESAYRFMLPEPIQR